MSDLIKSLTWDVAVESALVGIFGASTLSGPVGPFLLWVASFITDKLYSVLKTWGKSDVVIPFKNNAHYDMVNKAASSLALLAGELAPDAPAFKEARREHQKSLLKFVTFDI